MNVHEFILEKLKMVESVAMAPNLKHLHNCHATKKTKKVKKMKECVIKQQENTLLKW
jgi:hypothetical protein